MRRRRCRASRTATARHPYLGGTTALPRGFGAVAPRKKGRDAAPSGSQDSGAHAPFLDAKAAHATQVGRRRPPARSLRLGERSIPTLGGTSALPRGFGAVAPRKIKVGTPRRRGPKIQARTRRFWMQRRLAPRKSDGDGLRLVAYASESAPSLPWGERVRCRAGGCGSTS